jgi:hypothetical protein
MIRCHSTLMRSFIIAFLDLLPTHTMSTSSPLDDNLLAIEKIVADALAEFSPSDYGDWDGVGRQLQGLLAVADSVEGWDIKQLLQSCRCGLFRRSIQAHIKLENSDHVQGSHKNLLVSYHFQIYEITVIHQVARKLAREMVDETYAKVPVFVKILELPSLSEKIRLRGCVWLDEDLHKRREELAALLKTYSQRISASRSRRDAEWAKIQESAAQLQRLAEEAFFPLKNQETSTRGSLNCTNMPPDSTTSSPPPSLTLLFPASTGSGKDVSGNTPEITRHSNPGAFAGGTSF